MISAFVLMPYNPGDVIMALQAIQDWHRRHSDWAIDFIVGDDAQELAGNLSWLRRVIPLPRRLLRHGLAQGESVNRLQSHLAQCLEPLKHESYDCGINLFQGRWGAYLTALLNANLNIGLGFEAGVGLAVRTSWMQRLMALPVDRGAMPMHAIDFYRLALEEGLAPLADSQPPPETRLDPIAISSPAATEIFPRPRTARTNSLVKPKAILHPGSAWLGKRWPISHWVALSNLLLQAGWHLTIAGSGEESELREAWPPELRQGLNSQLSFHFGSMTWSDFIALGKQSDWMISGDTVAMHLGAATGCRVLALFGASNPRETGPYGPGHFVLETEIGPYPADLSLAVSHPGLKALRPQSVADFLLRGQAPEEARLWETRWLPWGLQGLCNAQGQWAGEKSLKAWWEAGPAGNVGAQKAIESRPLLLDLQTALHLALSQAQSQIGISTVVALEKAEQAWAAATQNAWVWETYRIALNGISPLPLKVNLQSRADLLYNTLREEGRTLRKSRSGIAEDST